MPCFFATDLHGHVDRYETLFRLIREERPRAVFLGGDLLPHALVRAVVNGRHLEHGDFIREFIAPGCAALRRDLADSAPEIFLILGNDDARCEEEAIVEGDAAGLWHYAHGRRIAFGDWGVFGYACVPPTPFRLKDWERYDVSRFVDPGCISPEEGFCSVPRTPEERSRQTIQGELAALMAIPGDPGTGGPAEPSRSILLFHCPPYDTPLDRAALDGMQVDHVPLDVHVGSIAIRRLIEESGPAISLHGHVHEAPRITGEWRVRLGRTTAMNAAHDGPELCLVRFDPERPDEASRELI